MESLTPMMKQYKEIKARFQEEILFFRMGDFYEMFHEDAEKAASILEIALTKRNQIPMCGIPYHAKDNYIFKIIKAGLKVAICDQLESPATAKGIVKRGVTEVITPGTLVDDRLLSQTEEKKHNFIMALIFTSKLKQTDKKSIEIVAKPNKSEKNYLALAYVDISTGDFFIYEEEELNLFQAIIDRLYQLSPSELILPESIKDNSKFMKLLEKYQSGITKNYLPHYRFDPKDGEYSLKSLLKVQTLKGFALDHKRLGIGAAGALIYYLQETQLREISHLTKVLPVEKNKYMVLNETTIKNLELVRNLQDGTKTYTLYNNLNETNTAMGARLLHQWILSPLLDIDTIKKRHDIVAYFFKQSSFLQEIRTLLKQIIDIERLTSKISLNKVNAKELIALKSSLIVIEDIKTILGEHELLSNYSQEFPDFQKVISLINTAILDEPAIDFVNGAVIQTGYNHELDELRDISQKGKDYLIELQEKEKEKLKISNLKIKYNKVIGYFIEVSKANSKYVPDYYIKKQSLVNSTRYTLPELTEYESKILGAQEKIIALERELFEELRLFLCEYLAALKNISEMIAEIDILSGFANLALHHNYIMPEIHSGHDIIIQDGRHPVVESHLTDEFIPNDLNVNNDDARLLLITGPNMAGKSTYLRQVALLIIMAQIGSFIPAQYAKIALVDKIFTRIGASDNLARGESTFLVEMIETAIILNNATERSLIIMDEIGRGTSTYDGLSIAWSIVEYLTQQNQYLGKVLFATHYHELTSLAKEKGIQCHQVLVKEWGDEIIFLHKVKEGSGSKSYGIQVARLAGLPDEVIQRAREILYDLENRSYQVEEDLLNPKLLKNDYQKDIVQFDLFPQDFDQLAKEVLKLDINASPALLLKKIEKLQQKIRKGEL